MKTDGLNDATEQTFDPANKIKQQNATSSPDDDLSLLEMEPLEAASAMLKDWDESWKDVRNLMEQWKVNKARADGYTGVQLVKRQDRSEAAIPYGAKRGIGGLNKAGRLKRRIRANVFSDPPVPECTPAGDNDDQRDAAETATRVLQYQCGEGQLDLNLAAGDAFDLGSIYGSGFIRFWVDESGGGYLPKQIEASPQATSPDDPMPKDPMTGHEIPCDPILRYVTEDNQFTEERTEAARVWRPRIKRELLTGKHVRLIPFNSRDVWEADGAMVGAAVPLQTLKAMFPQMRKWKKNRIAALVTNRPQRFTDLLPANRKDDARDPTKDDALVFVLTRYHVQSPKYPEGAYLIAAGKNELLHRQTWFDDANVQPLDIPITQYKQLTDEDNPYGNGVMTELGPGNELRAAMWGSELEHLDRFNNRKIFVPMTSTMQAQQFQSPTGTPIPILPGGEPKYEEVPDFPAIVQKMEEQASLEMDDESGLQQQAQGLNASSVTSGKQADTILQTVRKGLSDLWDNTERGLVRGWRIVLQLDRCFFTDPQLLRFKGADGAFKLKQWKAADFGDTEDVRVQRGTFTGMSPQQKAAQAVMFAQLGLISKPELEHLTEGNIGGQFGLQDNPHRNRVRRQIAKWQDGPPEGWQPPQPLVNPATQEVTPPQPDPLLTGIFDQRPTDTQPDVAMMRVFELGRVISGTAFSKYKQYPAWQQALAEQYVMASKAAQVMDAESVAKLQEQGQKLSQELEATKAKLAEKPSVSLQLKPGFNLTPEQTAAILAQEGIQFPLGGMPLEDKAATPPDHAPQEMQQTAQLEREKMQTDLAKHAMTQDTALKVAEIGAKAKAETAKVSAKASGTPGPQARSTEPKGDSEPNASTERLSQSLKLLKGGKR